jgi:hypothetical protein
VLINKPVSCTTNCIKLKSKLSSPTFTGTVVNLTKAMVGLGNVDNVMQINQYQLLNKQL